MNHNEPIDIKDIETTAELSAEEMENVKGGAKGAGGGDNSPTGTGKKNPPIGVGTDGTSSSGGSKGGPTGGGGPA